MKLHQFTQAVWNVIACVLFLLPYPRQGCAGEFDYPKAAYSPAELIEVRRWEDQWTGRKISRYTVDSIRAFLPESFYNLIRDSEAWGESWFTVAAYRQIVPTPGEIKFTKQYYGVPRIGPQDELLNWVAGIPFPEPDSGLAVVHNFKRRNNGDSFENSNTGYIVDGKMKYEMLSRSLNRYCFWAGRYDTPPVPAFPDNQNQIWRTGLVVHADPPENRNLRTLEIQYKDELRPYDSWSWIPATRRVQRRTTTAREDAVGGTDYCEYDSMGYDGPVQANTYTCLGQKDFLWARHIDTAALEHTPGTCLWSGAQRERLKTHVIEVRSKQDSFIYSRQTWYIDPETWQILYAERYDREGKLWRILDQFFFIGQGYNDVALGQYTAIQSIDVQNRHTTVLKSDMKFGISFDMALFTREYLQKNGY